MPIQASSEIISIGVVAVTFGSLMLKMWKDHTALTEKVTKVLSERITTVLERNAAASERLSASVNSLEKSTAENTRVTEATKQSFNDLVLRLIERK